MKMELLQGTGRRAANRTPSPGSNAVSDTGDMGLAGRIWEMWGTLRANYLRGQLRSNARAARQMEVIELLGLGGRRQLALVRCGAERFLVGCGPDQVNTITRVSPGETPKTTQPLEDA